MACIYIDTNRIAASSNIAREISSRVKFLGENIQKATSEIDWDVKFASDINSTSLQLFKELNDFATSMFEIQTFMLVSKEKYEELDIFR